MDLSDMINLTNTMTQANNEWSAVQAQKQMDFQREMSNTAHRREVADLKAAGLNPILSAHGNGASTPSGAMGGTDNSNVEALVSLLTKFGESIGEASARGAASGSGSGVHGVVLHDGSAKNVTSGRDRKFAEGKNIREVGLMPSNSGNSVALSSEDKQAKKTIMNVVDYVIDLALGVGDAVPGDVGKMSKTIHSNYGKQKKEYGSGLGAVAPLAGIVNYLLGD